MLKLIRDVFLLLVLALLFDWHYRDRAAVQKQRTIVECCLKRAGIELETVRRYWPLEGCGVDLLKTAKEALAPYNPTESAQKVVDTANQKKRLRDETLKRATEQQHALWVQLQNGAPAGTHSVLIQANLRYVTTVQQQH